MTNLTVCELCGRDLHVDDVCPPCEKCGLDGCCSECMLDHDCDLDDWTYEDGVLQR